jgi:HSP20 family protein
LALEPRECQTAIKAVAMTDPEARFRYARYVAPCFGKQKGVRTMALFPDPFNTLLGLQQALESFRTSGWLQSSPSGGGSFPPINIFRKNDDFVLIAEVPGINKSDLDLQVKDRTIRISGTKAVKYTENASLHRRERLAGRFDRSIALPFEIDPDGVKAECGDGILALSLPQAERGKARSIKIG